MMQKYKWLLLISGIVLSCKNDQEKDNTTTPQETTVKQAETKSQMVKNDLTGEMQKRTEWTEIKKVSIAEAKNLAKQGYKFLDIRLPSEIERGKIDGALEMNVKSYDFQHNVNKMERDVKLIVYCSTGNRSALASKLFSTLGFTNVVEMPGGYSEWRTTENK